LSTYGLRSATLLLASRILIAVISQLDEVPRRKVPLELIGRIASTRTEGINLRGVFSFPIEQYAEYLLPTWATKSRVVGA
jgi:hypothetical protein